MFFNITSKYVLGTYSTLDGEKTIIGKLTQSNIPTKEEAIKIAKNDDSFIKKWFGLGETTHSAICKEANGTYSVFKVDQNYTQSIAYGSKARTTGIPKPNVEFID